MKRRQFSLQEQYELASLKRGMQELGVPFMNMNNNNDLQNTNQNAEENEEELTDILERIDGRLDTHGASIDALIQTLPVDIQAQVRAQLNQQQDAQQQEHLTNLRRDVDDIREALQRQEQKTDALHSAVELLRRTLDTYYASLINQAPGTPPKKPQNPGDMQQTNSNGQNNNASGNTTPQSPDVSVNGDTRPYKLVRKRGGRIVKRWMQPEKNKRAV